MNNKTETAGFSNPAETWNKRFECPEYIFGTAPNAYLARQAGLLLPGQSALAVADGEGRNSVWLAEQGLQVDAFDLSPVAIAKARRLAQQHGVTVNYAVAACDTWSWEIGRYDLVAAIFVQFAAPAMRARLFSDMMATLKPGGLLILQGYTPQQLAYKTGGPPALDHLYTEDMLRQAFAGHAIVDMQLYEADIEEGRQHLGWSALVGMVIRKQAQANPP